MFELNPFVDPLVSENLGESERIYLHRVFELYKGYPSLQQLWQLMDEQWFAHGCDPLHIDGRISAFYRHPVWLLNGLFIEQDIQSLSHRQAFAAWVTKQAPLRVADFGGGFGGLARFIGTALPHASVEVVEPHPHTAAIALAAETPNVRFVSELTGSYDLLIATDVFEHVPDPIGLAFSTAGHLRIGGHYLIANCFAPVIACHLPQLLHLSIGWDQVMRAMGFNALDKVMYGRAYVRIGELDELAARRMEVLAQKLFPMVQLLPRGRALVGRLLMRASSAITAY